jgi:hypothetical protein
MVRLHQPIRLVGWTDRRTNCAAAPNCTGVLTEMINICVRQNTHINKACTRAVDDAQIRILQLTQFVCQTCKTQGGSNVGGGGGGGERAWVSFGA